MGSYGNIKMMLIAWLTVPLHSLMASSWILFRRRRNIKHCELKVCTISSGVSFIRKFFYCPKGLTEIKKITAKNIACHNYQEFTFKTSLKLTSKWPLVTRPEILRGFTMSLSAQSSYLNTDNVSLVLKIDVVLRSVGLLSVSVYCQNPGNFSK